MRFRYREYLGGPDPLAEPDPPPDEAVAAARELLSLVEAAEVEDAADREALSEAEKALSRYGEGDRLAVSDVDPRLLARLLGPQGRAAVDRWDAADHTLSPRELRRLADVALRDTEEARRARGSGSHRGGVRPGGEPDGTTRAAAHGSVVDAVATVRAATLRRAEGRGRDEVLRAEDLRADGTEPSGASAVSLLVDLSHSMSTRGLHETATRTALALHALVGSHYPEDRLQLVGFGEVAREMSPGSLVAHGWGRVPGTNLQEALRLARGHMKRHPDLHRHVMVVTDGEPTAYTGADGDPRFSWPAGPRTVEATVGELDAALRDGAEVTFFLLADDPQLRAFATLVERRRGVRVVRAGGADLGPAVLDRFHEGR
ncbi:VWA domain-containing protein [Nocardiopsis sp. HNM0947]|uniref:VWA domain-containing protein n=1 Tax=Nocardiopsis coralli TaxID=2772213 RepID=A0ABR9P959_9ACTN|nr:VWA domain-containing protein [Nocardiopsis coralli]MBE3000230.1 VWA domain-containing protein [Nocardiopsis coralli]